MVTVISRFRVRNGLEEQVRKAFLERPRLVESESGFCGLEVLTDASDPAVFLLLTRCQPRQPSANGTAVTHTITLTR